MKPAAPPPSAELRWRLPLQLRWPLAAAIMFAFALGQLAEALLLGSANPPARMLMDVLAWGVLGGLAVWISLTWVSRREQHYQATLERALRGFDGWITGRKRYQSGTRAALWIGKSVYDLNDLLDKTGRGWMLVEARDINSAGQITGWGRTYSGEEHAFLLTPDTPIPLPAPGGS